MPTRSALNHMVWSRQFRTLLLGGLSLLVVGAVLRLLDVLPEKSSLFMVFGTTVAVIGLLGFGILALIRRRR